MNENLQKIEIVDKTMELMRAFPGEATDGSRHGLWVLGLNRGYVTPQLYNAAILHYGKLWTVKNDILCENGYLYSVYHGQVRVQEGSACSRDINNLTGYFKTKIKKYLCSFEPGVVYNSVVWLDERDDELGLKILIENEENNIRLLEEKIVNHQIKIQKMKGEWIDYE